MRSRSSAPFVSGPGKIDSFLKQTVSMTASGQATKMQWIALAMVLGCLLGGFSATLSSQYFSSTTLTTAQVVHAPALETDDDDFLALQNQIRTLTEELNKMKKISETISATRNANGSTTAASTVEIIDVDNYVAPRSDYDVALKEALEKLPQGDNGRKEVLIAVSNKALIDSNGTYGMLATWIEQVKLSGVKNAMVVCLDDEIVSSMQSIGFPYWKFTPKMKNRDQNLDNHGISGLKYMILKEFLVLGYRFGLQL